MVFWLGSQILNARLILAANTSSSPIVRIKEKPMQNRLLFLPALFLVFALTNTAQADVRDVRFSAQQETAQVLFQFDGQPSAVKVFITQNGLDVDILGIEVSAAKFAPGNANLIQNIQQIVAPGGARLRLRLSELPLGAKAEIYRNSVLVTATFSHVITRAHDALAFTKPDQGSVKNPTTAHVVAAKTPAKVHTNPPVKPEAQPIPAEAKHQGEQAAQLEEPMEPVSDVQQPGHDGQALPERIELPNKPAGHGMIREASLRAAGKLNKEQCTLSEQAVRDDPWALDNLARFGACLSIEGKTTEAQEVFERLLTFDPETFAAYVGLGAIAQDAGQKEKAREYYEEALALGGTDSQAAQARDLMRSLEDG